MRIKASSDLSEDVFKQNENGICRLIKGERGFFVLLQMCISI